MAGKHSMGQLARTMVKLTRWRGNQDNEPQTNATPTLVIWEEHALVSRKCVQVTCIKSTRIDL